MMSSGYSLQQKYCRENHVQPCPSCVQMGTQTAQRTHLNLGRDLLYEMNESGLEPL